MGILRQATSIFHDMFSVLPPPVPLSTTLRKKHYYVRIPLSLYAGAMLPPVEDDNAKSQILIQFRSNAVKEHMRLEKMRKAEEQ